jgi:hypothetical protein
MKIAWPTVSFSPVVQYIAIGNICDVIIITSSCKFAILQLGLGSLTLTGNNLPLIKLFKVVLGTQKPNKVVLGTQNNKVVLGTQKLK